MLVKITLDVNPKTAESGRRLTSFEVESFYAGLLEEVMYGEDDVSPCSAKVVNVEAIEEGERG